MVLFMVGSVLAAHSKGNEPFDDDQDDDYVHKEFIFPPPSYCCFSH